MTLPIAFIDTLRDYLPLSAALVALWLSVRLFRRDQAGIGAFIFAGGLIVILEKLVPLVFPLYEDPDITTQAYIFQSPEQAIKYLLSCAGPWLTAVLWLAAAMGIISRSTSSGGQG